MAILGSPKLQHQEFDGEGLHVSLEKSSIGCLDVLQETNFEGTQNTESKEG